MKRILYFVFCASIFCITNVAHANVVINEIMYDLDGTDTNREWVEIKNDGNESVDLSSYKFFEANTNHSLNPIGSSMLSAGGYAVIVQNEASFHSDWPDYSGLIFDSTFSLNNESGELLGIKDGTNTIVDQVTYTADSSGGSVGKSLQRNGSDWVTSIPTPGLNNATSNSQDSSGETITSTTDTKKETKVVEVPHLSAEIILQSPMSAFIEEPFEARVYGYDGNPAFYGKFVWNFGDGTQKESLKNEKQFHQYKYAGDYIVSFEYYSNPYTYVPDITLRKDISVSLTGLSLYNVDESGSVFIKNSSSVEENVGGYIISSPTNEYIIPKNTFIGPGKTLILVSDVLPFSISQRSSLSLLYPNKKVISSVQPATKNQSSKIIKTANKIVPSANTSLGATTETKDTEIKNDILTASVANASNNDLSSDIVKDDNDANMGLYGLLLFSVVTIAIASVYFLRKKNISSDEKTIEDITIVE
jgi:hypothetical protein